MKPLAVYVHIPFCVVKCGYCDFNTYAGLDRLKPGYGEAMLREVEGWAPRLAASRVTSISFGGGTPGEFPAEGLVAVVETVRRLTGEFALDAEVSLEANPGSTSLEQLESLVLGGFNRVSFGAQSFDAEELRFLDRTHSAEATRASVGNAARAGFRSIGLDLIYGLPGQSVEDARQNAWQAASLGVDHVSCYALTVEEGTPLARKVAAGDVREADPDTVAAMYEAISHTLETTGFHHYEISNWAKRGHESRHNSVYWTGGDYLGIGAGAHGFLDRERYENVAHPAAYIATANGGRGIIADRYRPDAVTAFVDRVETGLRLIDGFAFDEAALTPDERERAGAVFAECQAAGLIEVAGHQMRLTPRGRLLHGEVCARLLARLT